MDKRCENCKYYQFNMVCGFCTHINHDGVYVAKHTVCDDWREKLKLRAPFDNLKLYLADGSTGEMKVTYVCEDCGKEMDKPYYWQYKMPVVVNGKKPNEVGYFFYCEKCHEKRSAGN